VDYRPKTNAFGHGSHTKGRTRTGEIGKEYLNVFDMLPVEKQIKQSLTGRGHFEKEIRK
jgi:hypothetical protein